MKKILFIGLVALSAVALVSCKSSESSYKKAYEKAQQEAEKEEQAINNAYTPAEEVIAPVVEAYPTNDDPSVRSEKLQSVTDKTLRAFNVVCGSFKNLDNAQRLCDTLKARGCESLIAQNPETGMYRVIAASSDSKQSAIATRDNLRGIYPDAWLLYNIR